MTKVADHIAQIREQIASVAGRTGRSFEEITLVAVTKKKPAESVREALATGLLDIGENYVQEAAEKRTLVVGGRWHLMGHLQSNKARAAIETFDLIQSLDSVKLARTLNRHAQDLGKVQNVLLQVHLGDEETKTGLPPAEALDAAAEATSLANLNLRGLMAIAPGSSDPRPYFRQLRQLFERLPAQNRAILSMGMSSDFETAIEEGSTMIRVGTAIFGAREF
jgi:pyridoxal phosphate enzyme (YggS family)